MRRDRTFWLLDAVLLIALAVFAAGLFAQDFAPMPPDSAIAPGPPRVSISKPGGQSDYLVAWTATNHVLESAPDPLGPWTMLSGNSPLMAGRASPRAEFFRSYAPPSLANESIVGDLTDWTNGWSYVIPYAGQCDDPCETLRFLSREGFLTSTVIGPMKQVPGTLIPIFDRARREYVTFYFPPLEFGKYDYGCVLRVTHQLDKFPGGVVTNRSTNIVFQGECNYATNYYCSDVLFPDAGGMLKSGGMFCVGHRQGVGPVSQYWIFYRSPQGVWAEPIVTNILNGQISSQHVIASESSLGRIYIWTHTDGSQGSMLLALQPHHIPNSGCQLDLSHLEVCYTNSMFLRNEAPPYGDGDLAEYGELPAHCFAPDDQSDDMYLFYGTDRSWTLSIRPDGYPDKLTGLAVLKISPSYQRTFYPFPDGVWIDRMQIGTSLVVGGQVRCLANLVFTATPHSRTNVYLCKLTGTNWTWNLVGQGDSYEVPRTRDAFVFNGKMVPAL